MALSRRGRSARALLTAATLTYGVLPLLADLNATHVLHPDWTPHARLHTVWLLAFQSLCAALALYLLWVSAWPIGLRLRVAGAIGACALGGFVLSAATRGLYGGALGDPGSAPPAILGVDANLLAFSTALGVVLLALFIAKEIPALAEPH